MSIQLGVLGSGSTANAYFFQDGEGAVMIDNGFSLREAKKRLQILQLYPEKIQALLVTHTHDDHVRGVAKMSTEFDLPVYLPRGIALDYWGKESSYFKFLEPYFKSQVGDFSIFPFSTSHDSGISVGYSVCGSSGTLVVITDTGMTDDSMLYQAVEADILVLESNYSARMLKEGHYPEYLKERIKSPTGHLSNTQAGAFLADLSRQDGLKVKEVVLVHLSDSNNTPECAQAEIRQALRGSPWEKVLIHIAQDGDTKKACGEPRIWVLPKKAAWSWRA